jgi:hypothetical protein
MGEVEVVQFGAPNRNFVGMDQARLLEHALHFFAGGDLALVCPAFNPYPTFPIHVGFVQPQLDLDDHDETLFGANVSA